MPLREQTLEAVMTFFRDEFHVVASLHYHTSCLVVVLIG
jgi:hypothetical protein